MQRCQIAYNQSMNNDKKVRIIAFALIGIVFILNVQAGIDFYFFPQKYTAAYELTGIPGNISVAGVGLLFIMWNVPYAFALWNPIKFNVSLLQAIIMQAIGVVGESLLLTRFSSQDFPILKSSILRFIYFDSAGLILLLIAGFVVLRYKKNSVE